MKEAYTRWWLIACSIVFAFGVLVYKHMFEQLWMADKSKISFIIIPIFFLVTTFIGSLTHSILIENRVEKRKYLDACWFASELLMGLGMVGTLVGFMLMLGTAMDKIDFSNVNTLKAAIVSMALGMSTAVTTTLVGLTCSLIVKLQLVNLETHLEKDNDES